MDDQAKKQTLHLRIVSPRGVIFEGEAGSVSSKNSVGDFDILPQHANFITIVENQPISVKKTDDTQEDFHFDLAIIYTRNNQVNVYTDIRELPKLG